MTESMERRKRKQIYIDKRVICKDFKERFLRNRRGEVIAHWLPGYEAIITDVLNDFSSDPLSPFDFIVMPIAPGFGYFFVKSEDIDFT